MPGAITEIAADAKTAVANADLVILCARLALIADLARTVNPLCRPGTLITDAGSTKARHRRSNWTPRRPSRPGTRQVRFVGSHPLAGNEKTGPRARHGRPVRGPHGGRHAVPRTRGPKIVSGSSSSGNRWARKCCEMSPEEHDRALAVTSHCRTWWRRPLPVDRPSSTLR